MFYLYFHINIHVFPKANETTLKSIFQMKTLRLKFDKKKINCKFVGQKKAKNVFTFIFVLEFLNMQRQYSFHLLKHENEFAPPKKNKSCEFSDPPGPM